MFVNPNSFVASNSYAIAFRSPAVRSTGASSNAKALGSVSLELAKLRNQLFEIRQALANLAEPLNLSRGAQRDRNVDVAATAQSNAALALGLRVATAATLASSDDAARSTDDSGRADTEEFVDSLQSFSTELNRLYADSVDGGFDGDYIESLRSSIQELVLAHTDGKHSVTLVDGFRVDFSTESNEVIQLAPAEALAQSVRVNENAFNAALYGGEESGLINDLTNFFANAEVDLSHQIRQSGGLVNLLA
ncbi:hypothetical protein [Stieleria varia]|uniref:Uncharacterized protein n=2 Tax=Stieleria varia TaxID=2528005 RepID=A0A5C6B304_9BACT|nr:hypothetical protein [Stieleria varia]TWU05911.1 hypothetical protein Pla52n_16270 [Stieleria varia]